MSDINQHYRDPQKPYPKDDSPLLPSLTLQLEAVGISDPASKIYITTKNIQYFPLLAFLFAISQINKLHYSKTVCKYTRDLARLLKINFFSYENIYFQLHC